MRAFLRTKSICAIALVAGVAFAVIVLSNRTTPIAINNEYSGKIPSRVIMTTDGVKHIVLTEEIIGGGPEKGDIPSIDAPEFVTGEIAAQYLDDESNGIGLVIDGHARFYPFTILSRHEVANDTIGASRVVISYSPLCNSAMAFDPTVLGERVEFGTSGKLWNSGSILYDKKTDSLWSHILRQAIQGDVAGSEVATLPISVTNFSKWYHAYPDTKVLSKNTGYTFSYDADPYENYYTSNDIFFPSTADPRLPFKTYVFGIIMNSYAKAYDARMIKEKGEIQDTIGGARITLRHDTTLDEIQAFTYDEVQNESLLAPYQGYWLCWSSAYPNTQLY